MYSAWLELNKCGWWVKLYSNYSNFLINCITKVFYFLEFRIWNWKSSAGVAAAAAGRRAASAAKKISSTFSSWWEARNIFYKKSLDGRGQVRTGKLNRILIEKVINRAPYSRSPWIARAGRFWSAITAPGSSSAATPDPISQPIFFPPWWAGPSLGN